MAIVALEEIQQLLIHVKRSVVTAISLQVRIEMTIIQAVTMVAVQVELLKMVFIEQMSQAYVIQSEEMDTEQDLKVVMME